MQKRLALITLIGLILNALLIAAPADDFDSAIIKGKKLIEKGTQKFDEKTLMDARSHFERLLQNEEMQWLTHYYISYADYRLAVYYQAQSNKEMSLKYLDDGIEHIYASLEKNEKFADAHGLLSSLLGQKIGTDPALGMTLGMESMTAISDALEYGKNNPRVAMFSAISAYYTPEQFGGSKTKAMTEMTRAAALFEKENLQDKRLPDWGHDQSLTWLGRFHTAAGEFDLAKKNLEAALKLSPESSFAKSSQAQLKQKMAEK